MKILELSIYLFLFHLNWKILADGASNDGPSFWIYAVWSP